MTQSAATNGHSATTDATDGQQTENALTSGKGEPTSVEKLAAWSEWMPGIYKSRQGPRALGTVRFSEIEEKARQTLKDVPGKSLYFVDMNLGHLLTRDLQRRSGMPTAALVLTGLATRTYAPIASSASFPGC